MTIKDGTVWMCMECGNFSSQEPVPYQEAPMVDNQKKIISFGIMRCLNCINKNKRTMDMARLTMAEFKVVLKRIT